MRMDNTDTITASKSYQYIWAKTPDNDETGRYHPLLCHMLDVGAVAALVWEHYLPDVIKKRLVSAFGTDEKSTKSIIIFFAAAHDIGKATPAFQKRIPSISNRSELPYSENDAVRPHGFVTAYSLSNEFLDAAYSILSQISGGHHGVFPRAFDLRLGTDSRGNNRWKNARTALLEQLAAVIDFTKGQLPKSITDPAIVPILAGFISVVDWIGSNQHFFPCIAQFDSPLNLDPKHYWHEAQTKAKNALEKLGWLPAVAFAEKTSFDKVFSGFQPNPLQETVQEIVSPQDSPYLLIIEAPMGQGKTEAALYAADTAMCRGFARGMYIAMPTQATSNAMFKRVLDDYLKKRGHTGKLNLQLVHCDALLALMGDAAEGELSEFQPSDIDGKDADLDAQSWFTAKKRPLLAPFGVGTIDQSLLSVLQTKHWFVRMFGLAGKVVIFDEVHAYDAYMSTILERLLQWLAELDCTVILLSATLPESKRRALVKAYSDSDDAEYKRYPRITVAKPRHYPETKSAQRPVCTEIPLEDSARRIRIEYCGTALDGLASLLSDRLAHGGCAAVICNTVDRSIEVYKHLRDNLRDTECLLFHARTLQMWRREREKEVIRNFGKRMPQEKDAEGNFLNPDRPHRAVLVATQVIEQSLDLDFDIMISEIAPIDLLLQRCGRLHRHPRRRPKGLELPRFVILCDADRDGPPPESFGKNIEHVYDRYILLRTWITLRGKEEIEVPGEMEPLIEETYGKLPPLNNEPWENALFDAHVLSNVVTNNSIGVARQIIVRPPDEPSELIDYFNRALDDDEDPEKEFAVRAATRNSEPSIKVIFLSNGEKLPKKIGINEIRWLLDRSVSISNKTFFEKFIKMKVPSALEKTVHLRYCRLFEVGKKKDKKKDIVDVSNELGVVIND